MKNFPVTTSTLSAKDLGHFIAEKYGFDQNSICTLFRTGINHTYFINSNDAKYVVRVYSYNWRSEIEIQEEITLLNLLKEHGVSISYPIADKSGSFVQTINAPEGNRHVVVFSFAEGTKLRVMGADICHEIGTLMARMHILTQNLPSKRINYNAQSLLALPYKQTSEYFMEELPEMKFLKEQVNDISTFFTQAASKDIPGGIVHLDIWYDNMAVTADGTITLFDFDFCGKGWLVLDVAYFCKQLFHIEADKDQYEIKSQSFLKGYNSVRKITDNELLLLPKAAVAVWIFYLGVQCHRFDWSNIFLTENYLRLVYVAKIKAWLDYYRTREVTLASLI